MKRKRSQASMIIIVAVFIASLAVSSLASIAPVFADDTRTVASHTIRPGGSGNGAIHHLKYPLTGANVFPY